MSSKGHPKDYSKKPLDLTEREREEMLSKPHLSEIKEWLQRIKGKREGYHLSDVSFETVADNVKWLLWHDGKREDYIRLLEHEIMGNRSKITGLQSSLTSATIKLNEAQRSKDAESSNQAGNTDVGGVDQERQ
jgi:hypothetical protein